MSLEHTIMENLKSAMKAKDEPSVRAIRAIKAAIQVRKTDGSGKAIEPEEEIKLIQKLIKQRKESLDIYEKQSRQDLAKIEREEIEVLSKYLPAQLTEDEIRKIVKDIIEELGASSMKDMGKVMGVASNRLAGQADGKTLASVVKGFLAN